MNDTSYRFEQSGKTLMQRLFEAPAVGKMSPAAKFIAYFLLIFWTVIVLFPIYWVLITSFKDPAAVNQGPFYIPFVDFQPTLNAWRTQFTEDPHCNIGAIGRQFGLLAYNSMAFVLSPFVTIAPMEPQICNVLQGAVVGVFSCGTGAVLFSRACGRPPL